MGLTQSSGGPEGGTEGYHVHGVNNFHFGDFIFDIEQLCMLAMFSWSSHVRIALGFDRYALRENWVRARSFVFSIVYLYGINICGSLFNM